MIKLFEEKNVQEAFKPILKKAIQKIDLLTNKTILENDLKAEAHKISNQLIISPLKIDFKNPKVEVQLVNLDASQFPPGTDVRRGQSYPCARVSYTFTIESGDVELLCVNPTKRSFQRDVGITTDNSNEFTINYQTHYANIDLPDQLKQEIKREIRNIVHDMQPMLEALNNDIDEFNESLPDKIEKVLSAKQIELKKKRDQDDDLANF